MSFKREPGEASFNLGTAAKITSVSKRKVIGPNDKVDPRKALIDSDMTYKPGSNAS